MNTQKATNTSMNNDISECVESIVGQQTKRDYTLRMQSRVSFRFAPICIALTCVLAGCETEDKTTDVHAPFWSFAHKDAAGTSHSVTFQAASDGTVSTYSTLTITPANAVFSDKGTPSPEDIAKLRSLTSTAAITSLGSNFKEGMAAQASLEDPSYAQLRLWPHDCTWPPDGSCSQKEGYLFMGEPESPSANLFSFFLNFSTAHRGQQTDGPR